RARPAARLWLRRHAHGPRARGAGAHARALRLQSRGRARSARGRCGVPPARSSREPLRPLSVAWAPRGVVRRAGDRSDLVRGASLRAAHYLVVGAARRVYSLANTRLSRSAVAELWSVACFTRTVSVVARFCSISR